MRCAWLLAASLALGGCTTSPPAPVDVDYRYVLLGPEGVPVVRVITSAPQCPALDVDGAPTPMTVRMPPATIPVRPSRPDLPAPKASAFPVLTCEATLSKSAASASIAGKPLPLPKANPQRIVLIGDTGCRVLANYNVFQACNDPMLWPFQHIADAAAATRPDLVIHVGDYHYREGPCKAGDPACAGSPWGYGWDAWEADFFRPGRNLLATAPWIVLRGNHESCNRAGQGWWRFLDPRPLAPRQDCNLAADDDIGNYSDAYAVPFGVGTQMLVFDSSWVGVTPLTPADLMYRNYRAQLEQAFALGARTPRAWFLVHHPVLGFAPNPGKPQSPYPGNAGLQSVLQSLNGDRLFPANVEAVLSGHNHLLQVVDFDALFPPQLITGNGGDWLDGPLPEPFPRALQPAPGAVVAKILATSRFGFMTMEPKGAGWSMQAWDVDGKPLTSCVLGERRVACTPLPKP
jgi:hypothetical protein